MNVKAKCNTEQTGLGCNLLNYTIFADILVLVHGWYFLASSAFKESD